MLRNLLSRYSLFFVFSAARIGLLSSVFWCTIRNFPISPISSFHAIKWSLINSYPCLENSDSSHWPVGKITKNFGHVSNSSLSRWGIISLPSLHWAQSSLSSFCSHLRHGALQVLSYDQPRSWKETIAVETSEHQLQWRREERLKTKRFVWTVMISAVWAKWFTTLKITLLHVYRDLSGGIPWPESIAECICVLSTLTLLFWDGRGLVVGYGRQKTKVQGKDRCLHLSELTLNHSNHRNQVSGEQVHGLKRGFARLFLAIIVDAVTQ